MRYLFVWLEKTMREILKIAQREYLDVVKTKTFILSILFTPAIIGIIIFFSSRTQRSVTGPQPPRKVVIADLTDQMTDEVKESFEQQNKSHPQRQILLQEILTDTSSDELIKQKVRDGQLNAYFVLDKDSIEGTGKIQSFTRSTKIIDLDLISNVENLLNSAIF
jgi:ABC-type Na+ efflux pump permease subunit